MSTVRAVVVERVRFVGDGFLREILVNFRWASQFGWFETMSDSYPRPTAIFCLNSTAFPIIYPDWLKAEIRSVTTMLEPVLDCMGRTDWGGEFRDVEVIFSGWGMPVLNDVFLDAFPSLKLVLYGAGSVRNFFTEESRARGVRVCSAWQVNAIPVAEFAHAAIIFGLKRVLPVIQKMRKTREWRRLDVVPGGFRSKVGLVSLGAIGRSVAKRLEAHDVDVLGFDPYASDEIFGSLGLERASLERLFRESTVVSLHTPNLPETQGLITGELIASMPYGATLINTARPKIIDQKAMVEVLKDRTDLTAMLDVIDPEPLPEDSELWELPNVFLTPHVAGSVDGECARMGAAMLDELRRYLAGQSFENEVTPALLRVMA